MCALPSPLLSVDASMKKAPSVRGGAVAEGDWERKPAAVDSLSGVRGGCLCKANDGEAVKTVTLKPLSRARKERAPGIPCGMMRGKSPSAANACGHSGAQL